MLQLSLVSDQFSDHFLERLLSELRSNLVIFCSPNPCSVRTKSDLFVVTACFNGLDFTFLHPVIFAAVQYHCPQYYRTVQLYQTSVSHVVICEWTCCRSVQSTVVICEWTCCGSVQTAVSCVVICEWTCCRSLHTSVSHVVICEWTCCRSVQTAVSHVVICEWTCCRSVQLLLTAQVARCCVHCGVHGESNGLLTQWTVSLLPPSECSRPGAGSSAAAVPSVTA